MPLVEKVDDDGRRKQEKAQEEAGIHEGIQSRQESAHAFHHGAPREKAFFRRERAARRVESAGPRGSPVERSW